MILGKRVRIKWARLVMIAIAVYSAVWMGISLTHMVVLWHDEQHWNRQIAVVQGEQNQLRTDIRELRNPKTLSKMIQGTAPIPNPVFTTP